MNLQRLPLFQGLHPAAFQALERLGEIRDFAPGTVLWRSGSQARAIHIVLEGEVRVTRGTGERVRVLHTEGVGGTLGDVALFAGTPYPATAITATRTRCLRLDHNAVRAIIGADPVFALRLLQRLAQRVQQMIARLERSTDWPVQSRLAAFLLERAAASHSGVFSLGATQVHVAEELGTVREVVVRTLRELREQGLLETAGRGRYRITDATALRVIAERVAATE